MLSNIKPNEIYFDLFFPSNKIHVIHYEMYKLKKYNMIIISIYLPI